MPTLGVRSPRLQINRCKVPPTPPTLQSTYVLGLRYVHLMLYGGYGPHVGNPTLDNFW
jgi:hypothetical protein